MESPSTVRRACGKIKNHRHGTIVNHSRYYPVTQVVPLIDDDNSCGRLTAFDVMYMWQRFRTNRSALVIKPSSPREPASADAGSFLMFYGGNQPPPQ
jgi:hypothetical protein